MREIPVFSVCGMTRESAASVMNWTYPEPYALYSFTQGADTEAEPMNGVLAGFVCFGQAARIPLKPLHARLAYSGSYLDVGLGMAPDLCGKGFGPAFLQCGLAFAQRHLNAERFRLSVAAFNSRAIKVYERAGFKRCLDVKHAISGADFAVMIL
jgi:RimJ/RimL family protein N-acetyltransferase